MVVVSEGHVGGTHGSCIVSSAADMLWMTVVRGMREWGLDITKPVRTGGKQKTNIVFYIIMFNYGIVKP